RSVLDIAQEAGLIDREARKVWDHADYIPFYRQIDSKATFGARGPKGLSKQSSGIRMLKGGTAKLNDPMENLLMNFSRLVDASLKNNALRKTVDVLEAAGAKDTIRKIGYDMKPAIVPREQIRQMLVDAGTAPDVLDALPGDVFDGMAKLWAIQAPSDPDVIRVMRDGKPKFYRVGDHLLLQALTSFIPYEFPGQVVMRGAKTLLTRMVTATPVFMARNFIRDSVAVHAIGRTGFNPVDSIKGVVRSLKETGGFEQMLFAGASFQSGQFSGSDPGAAASEMRRALRRRGMNAASIDGFMATLIDGPARLWDLLAKPGEAVENGNREAIFEATIRDGGSVTSAAYEAKDLMDFSLRGSAAAYQIAADVLPFFNARMQGLYRLGRADPKRLVRVGGLIMVVSLLLALANDGEDWYEELPDWDKDTYWHFKRDGVHARLPKPFEIGVIFATVPERIGRAIRGLDTGSKLRSRVWSNIHDQLRVDPVPQAVRPLLDVAINKDSFRGTPIENMGDQGKLPSARFNSRTSDTARVAVQSVAPLADTVGLSPERLEHLIGGYFGTVGLYALGLSDMLVRELEGKPDGPTPRMDDIPLVRAFIRDDPARGTVFETDLWAMRREIDQIKRTILATAKDRDLEGARELQAKHADKLRAAGPVTGATNAMSGMGKMRDAIMVDAKLTPQQKRAKLDELQAKRNAVAKRAATMPAVREAF
ncbi:MAG: LPD38 domain-containing protein, partial [Casimicrobiaceae bacterium]